jgi:epoxyqueuosine reductase
MKEIIRRQARDLGFEECRFTTAAAPATSAQFEKWIERGEHGQMGYLQRNADKRVDPQQVLAGAKSIICLASSYFAPGDDQPGSTSGDSAVGLVARYARYQDYHDVLGARLKQLTQFLGELDPSSRSLWYVDTGPLLERDLAQRAGVGFVGKHTNVISRRLGNWIFLAEILTTLELPSDESETNRCGSCTRCLTACPTGAITAPFQLDARLCISYLTIELKGSIPLELRRSIGNRIYGCDDCLAVCPWNRFAKVGSLMQTAARPDLAAPDLLKLLALDDAGFKQMFSSTPILRTKRRGLLRNVCVALGNIGDRSAQPALEKAAVDHESLIVEHAKWAIEQIQSRMDVPVKEGNSELSH